MKEQSNEYLDKMHEEIDILSHLITVAPVVGVLFWVVLHFKSEIKKKDARIDDLNDELRTSEKEAITVIKDLNQTLEKLIVEVKLR